MGGMAELDWLGTMRLYFPWRPPKWRRVRLPDHTRNRGCFTVLYKQCTAAPDPSCKRKVGVRPAKQICWYASSVGFLACARANS